MSDQTTHTQAPQAIKDRIKELMVERLFLNIKPEDVQDEEPIMEAYGVDSVSLFELVAGLEEEYNITFEDTDFTIEGFRTVTSIACLTQEKLTAE